MKSILIMENDQAFSDEIAEILKFEEFNVIVSNNGRDGLSMALTHKPDLILCDVMISEIGSNEILKLVRADNSIRHTKFIYLSANYDHKEIKVRTDMGADGFLIKPFTRNEMLKIIISRLEK